VAIRTAWSTCNADFRVTSLEWQREEFTGGMHPEIGDLTELEYLDLRGNHSMRLPNGVPKDPETGEFLYVGKEACDEFREVFRAARRAQLKSDGASLRMLAEQFGKDDIWLRRASAEDEALTVPRGAADIENPDDPEHVAEIVGVSIHRERVTRLDWCGHDLQGTFPKQSLRELANLSELEYIDFRCNPNLVFHKHTPVHPETGEYVYMTKAECDAFRSFITGISVAKGKKNRG